MLALAKTQAEMMQVKMKVKSLQLHRCWIWLGLEIIKVNKEAKEVRINKQAKIKSKMEAINKIRVDRIKILKILKWAMIGVY